MQGGYKIKDGGYTHEKQKTTDRQTTDKYQIEERRRMRMNE